MTKQYYGPQTKKALKNFPFSFRKTPKEFMTALAEIKKASAIAHFQAKEISLIRKRAIVQACDEILAGKLDSQFVLPAFQGGAGTSNHMNINEVIAARATEIIQSGGGKIAVHPNDHVNFSHSTNDTMPSALKISAYRQTVKLLITLESLERILQKKAREFKSLAKLGRTHMQDAVPISLGDEFLAYAEYARKGKARIALALEDLLELNLGGSAVGNSINVSKPYLNYLYRQLRKITGLPLRPAKNFMPLVSSNSDLVALSQSLTALSLDMSKIANDLKLLSSGPQGGFNELRLPELQPGSSVMPGKVNPILPEAVNQLYFLVSGNNLTIEHAAHGAQLEMSAMLPVITDRLLESLTLAAELLEQFGKRCVAGIKANKKQLKEHLEKSTAYATFLTPQLGYEAVADAVKQALKQGKSLKQVVVEEKQLLTNREFNVLTKTK